MSIQQNSISLESKLGYLIGNKLMLQHINGENSQQENEDAAAGLVWSVLETLKINQQYHKSINPLIIQLCNINLDQNITSSLISPSTERNIDNINEEIEKVKQQKADYQLPSILRNLETGNFNPVVSFHYGPNDQINVYPFDKDSQNFTANQLNPQTDLIPSIQAPPPPAFPNATQFNQQQITPPNIIQSNQPLQSNQLVAGPTMIHSQDITHKTTPIQSSSSTPSSYSAPIQSYQSQVPYNQKYQAKINQPVAPQQFQTSPKQLSQSSPAQQKSIYPNFDQKPQQQYQYQLTNQPTQYQQVYGPSNQQTTQFTFPPNDPRNQYQQKK